MNRIRSVVCICLLNLCFIVSGNQVWAQPGQPNATGTVDEVNPPNAASRGVGDVAWNATCTMTNNHTNVILRMRAKVWLKVWNVTHSRWDTVDFKEETKLVDALDTETLEDVGKTTDLDVGSYAVLAEVWAEFTDDPAPGPPIKLDDQAHLFVVN